MSGGSSQSYDSPGGASSGSPGGASSSPGGERASSSSRARGGINTPARSKRKRTGADDSRPQSTPHDKTATEEPVLEDDEDAPIHRSIEALVQSPDDVRKDSSFKEFDQLLLSDETRNWARKLYIYPLECARGVRRRWPWTRTRLVAKRGARHGQDGPGPGVSGRG